MNNLDFWHRPDFDHALEHIFRTDPLPRQIAVGEISENATGYCLQFDLPGLKKEDIKVDLVENRLTVSGDRKEQHRDRHKKHRTQYSEISYGSFSRSYVFPTPVDSGHVTATYAEGVLRIEVPKSEGANSRQIPIQ